MIQRIRFRIALLLLLGVGLVAACSQSTVAPGYNVGSLEQTDLVVGSGAEAVSGAIVDVHYTGWLYAPDQPEQRGVEFDSSRPSGKPFSFPLGAAKVIPGWDMGVLGMKVGGKRRLLIPAELAYGDRGAGGGRIPPSSALLFEVELLKVAQ